MGTHRRGENVPSFRLIWAVDCPEESKQKGIMGYTMVEDTQLTNGVAAKIKESFPLSEEMQAVDWHLKSILAGILSKRILSFPGERNTWEGKVTDKIALHKALFEELQMKVVRAGGSIRKWENLLLILLQSLSTDRIQVSQTISPGEVENCKMRGLIKLTIRRSAEIDPGQALGSYVVVAPGYVFTDNRRSLGQMEVVVVRK
ncbi:MAG: hypothetical protein WC882_02465 [Candidatus Gracilibacteria bacterium]